MERNPNDNINDRQTGQGGAGGVGGTGGFAGSGGTAGAGFGATQADVGTATGTGGAKEGMDKARERVDEMRDKAGEKLHEARHKASEWKDQLADRLESGAQRLRQRQDQRAGAGTFDVAGDGSAVVQERGRLEQVSGGVATGMEKSAEWLRETDLQTIRSDVEEQVRNHPGRTLLVALGLGYLLGKAFRR